MTIQDYTSSAIEKGFDEHPFVIYGGITEMKDFVDYEDADIDLKIHLAKVILCRNFSPAGGYCVLSDHNWFIENFLKHFEADPVRPWLSDTIKESIEMILSEAIYTTQITGTTFMFGVVEFYAKYLLGWRPMEADFFDEETHGHFRRMSLSEAINKLKKGDNQLAKELHYVDRQSTNRLKEVLIEEKRWVAPRIADRLRMARNPMLHGENHSFSHIGKYLCMLYILFYLCGEKSAE